MENTKRDLGRFEAKLADGTVIIYQVELDLELARTMARKAAKSKSWISRDGPLKVQVLALKPPLAGKDPLHV